MSCAVSVPMPIGADALSLGLLLEGLKQLNFVMHEIGEIIDEKGHSCQVDFVIKTQSGENIGVRKNESGTVDFVVAKETEGLKKNIDQVKQVYSRLKILHEVKAKGYKQVKEEKLADGSIRLVVQKWR